MHRFFVSPEYFDGDIVSLPPDVSRQLTRVLRLRPGETILVLDNTGTEYSVELTTVDAKESRGSVVSKSAGEGEPRTRITLYQGVLKSDKFELVLQKGTELGVSTFVPVYSERSGPRQRTSGNRENRHTRWEKIIPEAAEQSGRAKLPVLAQQLTFGEACDQASGCSVIPWEEESATSLRSVIAGWANNDSNVPAIDIFIGPEGGYTSSEVDRAREKGIVPVSLGKRILRAETAGIATVAAVLYGLGDLGG